MRKKKAQPCRPCVCELEQLELPLEPTKTGSADPSKLPHYDDDSALRKTTQTALYADDRIGMTAFHFMYCIGRLAQKIYDATRNGIFEDGEAARQFGLEYAQEVFRWNYLNQKNKGAKK